MTQWDRRRNGERGGEGGGTEPGKRKNETITY